MSKIKSLTHAGQQEDAVGIPTGFSITLSSNGQMPQYQELESLGLQEDIPDGINRIYLLSFNKAPFIFVYLAPESYTLVWKGKLDFHDLSSEVFRSLLQSVKTYPDASVQAAAQRNRVEKAKVLLILKGNNEYEMDQLLEYDLRVPSEFSLYSKTISSPDRIGFARYEVLGTEGQQYVFTAENPLYDDQEPEFAVSQPLEHGVMPTLLEWIISHHSSESLFQQVDTDRMASGLSDLIASNDPHREDRRSVVW